jgi:hypothetical protein
MTGIEATYCKMLDTYYQGIVSTVELALAFPQMMAKRIIVFIKRLESVILATIEKQLLAIIELIGNLKPFKDFNKNKKIKAFCTALFKCQAAIQMLVDIGTITQADADNFANFERLVCRVGLSDFIKNYLGSLLSSLRTQADELLEKANTWLEQLMNQFINPYNSFLGGMTPFPGTNRYLIIPLTPTRTLTGIYEIMDALNAFAECGFAVCDFVTTAANKQDDWKTKLKVDDSGTFASKWMNGMLEKADNIENYVNIINSKIDGFFTAQVDKIESSEVAKDWVDNS